MPERMDCIEKEYSAVVSSDVSSGLSYWVIGTHASNSESGVVAPVYT